MTLPADISRCLGHTADGKPNGCQRLEACLRHAAIRDTPLDGTCIVIPRACGENDYIAYMPIDVLS